MNRRQILRTSLLAVLPACLSAFGQPAGYPDRPIRIVLPYPAGGGTDYFARLIAPTLGEALGQPVIVENRPGASGMIAAGAVARQLPADGYNVLLGDVTTYAVNPALFDKLPYDVERDLVPVTKTGKYDFVLVVNPAVLRVNSVAELLDAAAKSPAGLSYGSTGIGATHHLLMELLAKETGAKLVAVQYKGSGPAVQDLLAGVVGVMFVDRATGRQHIESGKLRALAVAGSKRIESFPNVPTLAEAGVKGVSVEPWQGFAVRSGTSDAIVKKIAAAYAKVAASAEIRRKLADAGIDVVTSTGPEFASFIKAETQLWRSVIRERGIKPE